MKSEFGKLFLAPLVVLALTSFAMVTLVDAAGRGGGGGGGGGARAGGGGGGGGARAGGGGGGGGARNVQASNINADVRTNNVRSTSVNNVNVNNVNRNVNNVNVDRNVNVNVNNGCCNGGWDNNYHPVATAAAVTAAVGVTSAIVGSMVRTVPVGCVPVNYGGMIYQQCGTVWYQPQAGQYVVINAPY
jgi:hypothetical protein